MRTLLLLSWEGMDEQTSLRGLHTFNWSSLKSLLILAFENTPAFSDTTHFDSDMVDTHQKVKNSLTFHWPFINEKQSMFTFALAFFAGHRYFSLNFQEEEGIWKENIQNQNHWPQPLYMSGVECQIDRFASLTAYFSSFRKKMHLKVLKKTYEL